MRGALAMHSQLMAWCVELVKTTDNQNMQYCERGQNKCSTCRCRALKTKEKKKSMEKKFLKEENSNCTLGKKERTVYVHWRQDQV